VFVDRNEATRCQDLCLDAVKPKIAGRQLYMAFQRHPEWPSMVSCLGGSRDERRRGIRIPSPLDWGAVPSIANWIKI
jgi:hypothetical protein